MARRQAICVLGMRKQEPKDFSLLFLFKILEQCVLENAKVITFDGGTMYTAIQFEL